MYARVADYMLVRIGSLTIRCSGQLQHGMSFCSLALAGWQELEYRMQVLHIAILVVVMYPTQAPSSCILLKHPAHATLQKA